MSDNASGLTGGVSVRVVQGFTVGGHFWPCAWANTGHFDGKDGRVQSAVLTRADYEALTEKCDAADGTIEELRAKLAASERQVESLSAALQEISDNGPDGVIDTNADELQQHSRPSGIQWAFAVSAEIARAAIQGDHDAKS